MGGCLAAAFGGAPETCQLSGRAEHAPPGTWAYVYPPEVKLVSVNCLDSVQLDAKGRFALQVPLSAGPEYYRLQFSGRPGGYWPVPLAPGRRVTFKGDMLPTGPIKMMGGRFTGSPETDREDEFSGLFRQASADKRAGKPDKVAQAQARMRQLVRRHLDSFQAAWWTSAYLAQEPEQRVFVDSITTVLRQHQPNSRFTQRLLARQRRLPELQPGQLAPNFALATAAGSDSLRLASLRGRYVVLHFWHPSSLDPAKVVMAPGSQLTDLVPLYQRLQGRPAELVSVALTPDMLLWQAAVQREPAVRWPQAREAQGYRGRLPEALGFNKSPSFVLIDPEGKLLGIGLELNELDQQLRQLLP
ncbi:hypothetical protein B0919_09505 [Hymenobacter sp. CRA2]|nr:hypothetical protein B0919_09505 [Hymenobacter sp. CRA2]